MAEQSGQSVDALQTRLDAMVKRHGAAAETDQLLADAVAAAHAVSVAALERLDLIEAEIGSAVSTPETFAMDTPAGAREFQRFLIAKQHEIIAVITDAREQAAMKATALQELQGSYRP